MGALSPFPSEAPSFSHFLPLLPPPPLSQAPTNPPHPGWPDPHGMWGMVFSQEGRY
jgi:hypothetical protein